MKSKAGSRKSESGKRLRLVATLFAVLVVCSSAPFAQPGNESSALDYDSFRIIAERNIFNPNRTSRYRGGVRREERRTQQHSFSLVGTITYDKGTFAFFDGSDSDLKQVLEVKGTIAGYTVVEITPNSAKLERDGNQIEMKVGSAMRREENGAWQHFPEAALVAATDGNAAEASPESSADPTLESNDVLKRLMQQKEQELK